MRELSFNIVLGAVCSLIYLLTFAWADKGKVTRFKVWRIRRFTRLKIYAYRKMPRLCKYFGIYSYLKDVEKKFG